MQPGTSKRVNRAISRVCAWMAERILVKRLCDVLADVPAENQMYALGESFLLGLVPVPVVLAAHRVIQMLRPYCVHGTQTTDSLHVPDNAYHCHGRSLHDSHGLARLLLVKLRAWLVHITRDMGHASLVTHESCEMRRLALVILGERFHLALAMTAPLLGQEAQRAVTRRLELTVGHPSAASTRSVLSRFWVAGSQTLERPDVQQSLYLV